MIVKTILSIRNYWILVMYSRERLSSTNAGRMYRLNRKIRTKSPNSRKDSWLTK